MDSSIIDGLDSVGMRGRAGAWVRDCQHVQMRNAGEEAFSGTLMASLSTVIKRKSPSLRAQLTCLGPESKTPSIIF